MPALAPNWESTAAKACIATTGTGVIQRAVTAVHTYLALLANGAVWTPRREVAAQSASAVLHGCAEALAQRPRERRDFAPLACQTARRRSRRCASFVDAVAASTPLPPLDLAEWAAVQPAKRSSLVHGGRASQGARYVRAKRPRGESSGKMRELRVARRVSRSSSVVCAERREGPTPRYILWSGTRRRGYTRIVALGVASARRRREDRHVPSKHSTSCRRTTASAAVPSAAPTSRRSFFEGARSLAMASRPADASEMSAPGQPSSAAYAIDAPPRRCRDISGVVKG